MAVATATHKMSHNEKDMRYENERWGKRWAVIVILDDSVARKIPVQVGVGLNFLKSVAERSQKSFKMNRLDSDSYGKC